MALVIDDTLISNVADNLRAAMTTDPKMRKVIQQHIREALFEARRDVMAAFPAEHDPREARRAIRTSVYDKVLGGNINILTGKTAHGGGTYEPQRTLTPGQRGGNRRKRSERTKQIMGYGPLDRGFILRFLASGTISRDTRYGNRGAIRKTDWFSHVAPWHMEQAASEVAAAINEYVKQQANG